MPDRPDFDAETLDLTQARRVNEVCERFEADWNACENPKIEDYLDHGDNSNLLRELIALEIELRQQRGEQPAEQEYRHRFPEAESWWITHCCRPDEPELIGDYELIEEIARGAMGVVYKARQLSLGRLVALKIMKGGPFASEVEVQRFQIEAEATAKLDHSHIVPIYGVGRQRGLAYYSMKLIDGATLSKRVNDYLDHPRATAVLLAKVARAVDYAHDQGFIHRDLKPGNILLDDGGEPHLIDFGLVKRVGAEADGALTHSGDILGTLGFMPPEQARGRAGKVTKVADIYSLGAILYVLLTGRPPFQAETVMELLLQIQEQEPTQPSRIRPGVDRDLEAICLKCLEKDPSKRYPTAAALAEDLERYLQGEGVEARQISIVGRLRRWARREPSLAARLLGLGTITVLTQYNFFVRSPDDRRGWVHFQVTAVELLWLVAALGFWWLGRREGWSERARASLILIDVVLLTNVLVLLDASNSVLIVGYPLLIVASGLWAQVGLVWMTTFFSALGYTVLWALGRASVAIDPKNHYLNIILVVLIVTGFIVAHQVKRVWALNAYYETARGTHPRMPTTPDTQPTITHLG